MHTFVLWIVQMMHGNHEMSEYCYLRIFYEMNAKVAKTIILCKSRMLTTHCRNVWVLTNFLHYFYKKKIQFKIQNKKLVL